jgi:Sulfotransferase domain
MAARMSGDTRAVRAWQQATARWRALPDFVIFGASKAGTTSMYDYLCLHPLVVPCRAKELHFADRRHNAARGERWYRSWFPLRATLARVGRAGGVARARCGEATPSYLARGGSAQRLHGVAPDVRLVALLREPGERAWSHYRMAEPGEPDPDRFLAAVEAEAEELADGWRPALDRDTMQRGLLRQSHYADELQEWYQCYSPDQILLVRSEDLFDDPATTYRTVCRHVGLPDGPPPAFRVSNAGRPHDLPERARIWLDGHFAEPNARLAELTGGAIRWP